MLAVAPGFKRAVTIGAFPTEKKRASPRIASELSKKYYEDNKAPGLNNSMLKAPAKERVKPEPTGMFESI